MPSRIVDTASFGGSADPQLSSPFFTLLPAEIRNLIYLEYWNLASTRQHIVKNQSLNEEDDGSFTQQFAHVPCSIALGDEDIRFDRFSASEPMSPEKNAWNRRLKSEWCLHWPCEEQGRHVFKPTRTLPGQMSTPPGGGAEGTEPESSSDATASEDVETGHQVSTKAGLMDVLTTCKRMYLECLPSLYANTTFIFTDTRTAGDFLSLYSPDADRYPLRSLELSIRVPNIITEIYYPPAHNNGDEGPPAIFAGRARPMLSPKNNQWQHLCDGLAELPNLQDLRIWLDSSDLRPWHKRVSETRFFGRLFDVRVPDKSRFVLGLPELPERRGPDCRVLEEYYLEGDKLEKAPFTVERGQRPNNWRVHLRSIVGVHVAARQAETGLEVAAV